MKRIALALSLPAAGVVLAFIVALWIGQLAVSACMIDSVPSATASGRVAILYGVAPGSIDPAHYAAFIIPGSFGAGWPLRFGERRQGLALTPSQSRAPWSWDFGDGATGRGHAVTHAYHAPGIYVLTVFADLPHAPAPFPFDRLLVRVLAPNRILPAEGANLLNGSRFGRGAALTGGLLPLRREAKKGLLTSAGQILGAIESGAWASIKDYWLHTRGHLPPLYARVDALLRREDAALKTHNRRQAAAIAAALPAAWARAAIVR